MPVPCFHADSSSVIPAQGTSFLALHLLLTQHMNSQMAGTTTEVFTINNHVDEGLVNDTVVTMRDGSPAIVSQLQPGSWIRAAMGGAIQVQSRRNTPLSLIHI